ncbi:MAG: thiopeptide-type bacteriocin biosynthesis protein [Solirubrobacteraceae bacterium]
MFGPADPCIGRRAGNAPWEPEHSRYSAGGAGADERWRMALCGAAALVRDFLLDPADAVVLMRRLRDAFGREHRADARTARALGERLRKERASLEPLLHPAQAPEHPLAPGFAVIAERSAAVAPLVAGLGELERTGLLTMPVADPVPSYVYMHVNRLIRSAARTHELVLYDFLARLYESRVARQRR